MIIFYKLLTRIIYVVSLIFAIGVSPSFYTYPRQSGIYNIQLSVIVTDKKGNPVSGLPQSSFSVLGDKVAQEVISFTNQDEPASIAIIFDKSGSIDGAGAQMMQQATAALVDFVELSNKSNEYFIIGFNNNSHLFSEGLHDAAINGLKEVASSGYAGTSAFYDACYLGIEKVTHGKYRKQAIILVTDGKDTSSSRKSLDNITRLLKEKNVLVYALKIGRVERDQSPYLMSQGSKLLDKLAAVSGGLSIYPKRDQEMNAGIELIAAELQSLYILGVKLAYPIEKGKCYSLNVKVSAVSDTLGNSESLSVRNRESYCAAR